MINRYLQFGYNTTWSFLSRLAKTLNMKEVLIVLDSPNSVQGKLWVIAMDRLNHCFKIFDWNKNLILCKIIFETILTGFEKTYFGVAQQMPNSVRFFLFISR